VGGGFYPSSGLSTAHQKRCISSGSVVSMHINRGLPHSLLEGKKVFFFFKRILESQAAAACKSEQLEPIFQEQETDATEVKRK